MSGNLKKDGAHLIRLALVFLGGLAVFVAVRAAVVPQGFGTYGHYRAAAIDDNRERKITYAGHETCEACHDGVAKVKNDGKHKNVACETCHGPNAEHANSDDPGSHRPKLPEVTTLCARCHRADAAKPHGFPQVNVREHSSGQPCNGCHQPHKPNF